MSFDLGKALAKAQLLMAAAQAIPVFVKLVEDTMSAGGLAGQGSAKLSLVREKIQAYLSGIGHAADTIVDAMPAITSMIQTWVTFFNAVGLFKTSKTKG